MKAAEARAEWAKKSLWKVCAFFGVVLLAFAGWALVADRPIGMPLAVGLGYLVAAAVLYRRRP